MLLLLLTILAAEPEWKPDGKSDAITVERREVPGSKFAEFRVQTEVTGGVDQLCDGIFLWASTEKSSPEVKKRTVLEDRGDTRVVHDELEAPIVAHRMVTFAITKSRAGDGTCSLAAHVNNDKAPKTPEGWVRLEKMDTSWRFEPSGAKTRVTFTLFVDPAGSVPAFIVHGAQRRGAIDTLKRALADVTRPAR